LWALNGGATAAGSGLVNGVLFAATVLAQVAVPRALVSWSTGRILVAGLLLLGVPAPGYLPSDGLGWVLGLSAVRGLGFGILTVVGSTVATAAAASMMPTLDGRSGLMFGMPYEWLGASYLAASRGPAAAQPPWARGPLCRESERVQT
jgi:hypothetical protein